MQSVITLTRKIAFLRMKYIISVRNIFLTIEEKGRCVMWNFSNRRQVMTDSPVCQNAFIENIAYTYSHVLAESLGCSKICALLFIMKNRKLVNVDFEHLKRTANFLKRHFEINEILKDPLILTVNPRVIENRYYILQEMGFSDITPGKLIRFNILMKKTPHYLSMHGLLPPRLDPVKSMSSCVKCPEAVKNLMKSKQPPLYLFSSSMINIKKTVHVEYLIWKLSSSLLKVLDLVEKYPSLLNRSFHLLERTYEILTEQFEFPLSKLMSNGFLLSTHPDNVLTISRQISQLGGIKIKEFAYRYPKILCVTAENLLETDKNLRDFGISDEQIQKYGNVYALKPDTVKERLQEWNKVSEVQVMHSYSKILSFVCHHNIAKERLQLLKSKGFTCQSLNILNLPAESFYRVLNNDTHSSYSKEVLLYLENLLGKDTVEVKKQLKKHPKSSRISPFNVRRVIEFLIQNDITKEQIWQGLPIVLYDVNVVIENFENIPYQGIFKSFSEAKNHFNFIQLLLYCIEKDHNFTGGGVYSCNKKPCIQDDINDTHFISVMHYEMEND